jgi:predicted CopG family antitoxin
MRDADYEARRERRERERESGLAFSKVLRERLEAKRSPVEALMEPEPSEAEEKPDDGA